MKTEFALAFVLAFVAGTAVAADGSVTGHYRAEGHDDERELCNRHARTIGPCASRDR